MDESTIIFNYNRAIGQAGDLDNIAKEVRKLADRSLTDSLTSIDKNWDGENSKKFLNKGNKLKGRIADSADDIQRIAESIRQMAEAIYESEMEAVRIAREREAME